MLSIPSPNTPIVLPPRQTKPGVTTSRVMMGSGAVAISASAAIDWLGGTLAGFGRLGLDAIGLQDPIFIVGTASLVIGAMIGRRARRW